MSKWSFPPEGGHMEKPSKIYYQTMTKKDVEERLKVNDVLLIPLGSTENHGDGQPYGEDTFIVTRMAEMIAQKTGCTVSEPVWFASHPFSHLGAEKRDAGGIDELAENVTGGFAVGAGADQDQRVPGLFDHLCLHTPGIVDIVIVGFLQEPVGPLRAGLVDCHQLGGIGMGRTLSYAQEAVHQSNVVQKMPCCWHPSGDRLSEVLGP